jgi:hypothetical protein
MESEWAAPIDYERFWKVCHDAEVFIIKRDTGQRESEPDEHCRQLEEKEAAYGDLYSPVGLVECED